MSYLNILIQPYTLDYANFIGLNTPWKFFAPDPGPALYLKSYIFKGEEQISEHLFPNEKESYFFRPMFNRRTAITRFLIQEKDSVRKVFIPWLCSLYPKATSISVFQRVVKIPSLTDVRTGKQLNQTNESTDKYFVHDDCVQENHIKDFINKDVEEFFEHEK